MEKVKALMRNKKFLRIFIPVLVLTIGLGVFAYIKLSDDSVEVEVGKVEYGTVQQFYDTTGTLESGSTEKYYLYEGVVVKEVNVKTGDAVSKGDVLATFDTSAMNKIISEKSKALKNAKEDYNNAVSAQNSSSSSVSIPTTTAPITIPTTGSSSATESAPQFTEEEIREIIAALQNSNNQNAETTTQPETTTQAEGEDTNGSEETTAPEQTTTPPTTRPTTTQPQFTEEELAAIANRLQASSNTAGQNISATMPSFDTNTSGSGLNLGGLMRPSSDMIDSYKKAYENAQAEYDKVVAEKKALDKGWIASGDGKVADIYIKAGEAYVYVEDKDESGDMLSMIMGSSGMGNSSGINDMLSSIMPGGSTETVKQGIGMVVDYYDGYKVTFNLGKYDAQTIKVGMPAFVSYTDYEYEAEITYIAPYAQSGSSAITTMMGSSSTTTSALPAEATITNSDNNLIIGFDAKLSILVAEHENVLKLPVEALVIEEGEKFVYIYDKATSTAVKKEVKTGVSSETHYEILDGLNDGDQVIINSSKVSDGVEVYLKK